MVPPLYKVGGFIMDEPEDEENIMLVNDQREKRKKKRGKKARIARPSN